MCVSAKIYLPKSLTEMARCSHIRNGFLRDCFWPYLANIPKSTGRKGYSVSQWQSEHDSVTYLHRRFRRWDVGVGQARAACLVSTAKQEAEVQGQPLSRVYLWSTSQWCYCIWHLEFSFTQGHYNYRLEVVLFIISISTSPAETFCNISFICLYTSQAKD
jgi:hypothetical protein